MYGIVSAWRKWQRASDEVMLTCLGLKQLNGVPQFFFRATEKKSSDIALLLAKYVDDLIIAGRNETWVQFARDRVGSAFDIGSWDVTPHELAVNSTAVNQSHDNIRVDIQNYVRDVVPILIPPGRRKQIHDLLTSGEVR